MSGGYQEPKRPGAESGSDNGLSHVTPTDGTPQTLSQNGDAHDQIGEVHRAQWEDYKRRFRPAEDALMDMTNDPQAEQRMQGRVRQDMGQTYDSMEGQRERRMEGMGVNMTGAQEMALGRQNALDQAAASAGAMNTARTGIEDRNQAAMVGGLGSLAKQRQNPKG